MNLEGKILGARYEIIEKIGVGGMATVYKARCHVLNRFVAVKILRDEFTTDEEFIRRFKVEAQSAASLTHPNIVSVYDVGNQENLYYIVMELIQGKTLKEIINVDGALPWKWSANIAIQIASALETAHRNKIIHRDIKPHNIIITEDGIAKVTDFGIAKAVTNSTITAVGATIGSVHYFSPEHAKGGYTDEKSDIYSLGVVLYEMVTGKIPFDADTPVSVALKHMQEEAIEPIKLNPMIPQSINDIIMKAMRKDASKRYQTASDMLKDLNMAIKNPEVVLDINKIKPQDFATQKLPNMYEKPLEERIKEKDEIMSKEEENKGDKKKKGFFKKHKWAKIVLLIVLAIALFVIPMLVMANLFKAPNKEVNLPDLTNMSLAQAEITLGDLNLKVEVLEEIFDEEVLEGFIISQDPKFIEGYKVRENSVVKVTVSKGKDVPEVKAVPDVAGKTREEAIKILEEAGFTYNAIDESSDKVEKGKITRQEPAKNAEAEVGSEVKIYISAGKEQATVPNVIGKTEEEAKKAITDAKLTVGTVGTEEDSSKSDGTVTRQGTTAGTKVDVGSTVNITVNKLPKLKSGSANIYFSLFTNYVKPAGEDEEPKQKELEVRVDGDTIHKQKYLENLATVSVSGIEGFGTVTVEVFVDSVKRRTVTMDLNTTTVIDIKP